jgi:hypothetical protein
VSMTVKENGSSGEVKENGDSNTEQAVPETGTAIGRVYTDINSYSTFPLSIRFTIVYQL